MDDRLVRSKSVTFTGTPGTSWAVNFDEVGALDNTHLLVLIVAVGQTPTITTPAGWTRASATTPIFAIQGDGAINGVTVITTSASEVTLTLLAFSGFVSATSLARQVSGWSSVAASTAQTLTPAWEGSYGVVIQAIEANESIAGATWTGLPYFSQANPEVNTARLRSVRQEWIGGWGVSGAQTVLQFAAPVTVRRPMYALYQLVEVNHPTGLPAESGPLVAWGYNEGAGDYSSSRGLSNVDMRALRNPWTASGHYQSAASGDIAQPPSVFAALDPGRGSTAPDKIVSQGTTILQTFTAMAWLYVEAYPPSGTQNLNSALTSSAMQVLFGVRTDGTLTPIGALASASVLPIGQWTHVAFTIDGPTNVGKLYINGTEVASNSTVTTIMGGYIQVGGLWNRAGIYNVGQRFQGRVDDVRIFDTVLNASQITGWMNTPVTNSTIHPLDGTVPVTTDATGSVSLVGEAEGTVPVLSTVAGDITGIEALGGTVPVTSASEGDIGIARDLAGTVPVTSAVVGTILALRAVEGSVPVLTAASGDIIARLTLGGTVSVLSDAEGTPRSIQVFAGTVPVTVGVEGDLSARVTMLGTVAIISDTEGDIVVHVSLKGTVVVLSTVSGDIEAPPQPWVGPLTLVGYAPRYGLCGEVMNLDLIGEVPHLRLEGSYE